MPIISLMSEVETFSDPKACSSYLFHIISLEENSWESFGKYERIKG